MGKINQCRTTTKCNSVHNSCDTQYVWYVSYGCDAMAGITWCWLKHVMNPSLHNQYNGKKCICCDYYSFMHNIFRCVYSSAFGRVFHACSYMSSKLLFTEIFHFTTGSWELLKLEEYIWYTMHRKISAKYSAQLSWHMQRFVAISMLVFGWEKNEIYIRFGLSLKEPQWNGPQLPKEHQVISNPPYKLSNDYIAAWIILDHTHTLNYSH